VIGGMAGVTVTLKLKVNRDPASHVPVKVGVESLVKFDGVTGEATIVLGDTTVSIIPVGETTVIGPAAPPFALIVIE
jgi:hypothetical protein